MHRPWWQTGAIYQVYLRSFQDSDGDGVGDLPGLRRRLPWLADLGVGAVWLSPVHPSPDVDFGYDVADYDGVHPRFGTAADLDAVIGDAHRMGLRVVLDGVFNHTSDQHPWFVDSRRRGPHADWYIWRDQPPNNWKSTFGGSAWTRDTERGQWYLHSFAPEQPDLNWRCPEVPEAVFASMARWFEGGIDGFRLDVFNCYLKDPDLRSNPRRANPAGLVYGYIGQHHVHDRDHSELAGALAGMRAVADRFPDRMLVGETMDERFVYDRAAPSVGPEKLHLAFHFGLLHSRWGAASFARAIRAWVDALPPDGWPTWVLSNHDFRRAVSRWGGRDDRARLLALLQCALRGTPFIYYGEEIGLREARLSRGQLVDPPGRRFWPFFNGRDGARTPMQWDCTENAGFSQGTPWLPVQGDAVFRNVEMQERAPASVLGTWKRALALRKAHPALHSGEMEGPAPGEGSVLSWVRSLEGERLGVALNMGDGEERLPFGGEVIFSTHGEAAPGRLQGCEGVVVRLG